MTVALIGSVQEINVQREVSVHILSFLPLCDLLNACLICKNWQDLAGDASLWRRAVTVLEAVLVEVEDPKNLRALNNTVQKLKGENKWDLVLFKTNMVARKVEEAYLNIVLRLECGPSDLIDYAFNSEYLKYVDSVVYSLPAEKKMKAIFALFACIDYLSEEEGKRIGERYKSLLLKEEKEKFRFEDFCLFYMALEDYRTPAEYLLLPKNGDRELLEVYTSCLKEKLPVERTNNALNAVAEVLKRIKVRRQWAARCVPYHYSRPN